jgi:hypothetical protein
LFEEARYTAKDLVEIGTESRIHPVVDDRIDTGVTHGKPVEEEVDMADVGSLGDGGIVEYKDEVDMIRCPTDHENENNNSKHLHNL